MLNFFIVVEESVKQLDIVVHIKHAGSFSDAMHSQLRSANICSFDACPPSGDGANSGSAERVIPDNKFLERDVAFLSNDPKQAL